MPQLTSPSVSRRLKSKWTGNIARHPARNVIAQRASGFLRRAQISGGNLRLIQSGGAHSMTESDRLNDDGFPPPDRRGNPPWHPPPQNRRGGSLCPPAETHNTPLISSFPLSLSPTPIGERESTFQSSTALVTTSPVVPPDRHSAPRSRPALGLIGGRGQALSGRP